MECPFHVPLYLGQVHKAHETFETKDVMGIEGDIIGRVSMANPLIRTMIHPKSLEMDLTELSSLFHRASDLWVSIQTEYEPLAVHSTGLPIDVVREKCGSFFTSFFRTVESIARVQLPSGVQVIERGYYPLQDGGSSRTIGYIPKYKALSAIMPGNHPGTHHMWLLALFMKHSLLVRPSFDDVFTPYFLTRCLYEAGLPEDVLFFLPGDHAWVDVLIQKADASIVFGGHHIIEKYGNRPDVKVYGPGRSKAVVLEDADVDHAIQQLTRLVLDDAGRGCVNVSTVIVEGDTLRARRIAEGLAECLNSVPLLHPMEQGARLPAVTNKSKAHAYASFITEKSSGARDVTNQKLLAHVRNVDLYLPQVFELPSIDHPLFGMELPFPFVGVVPARHTEILESVRHSLAVILFGEDSSLFHDILFDPTIGKLYTENHLSTDFDPKDPHEGFLTDFLFERKAIRF